MKERPILFSDPMVRAILGGRKTQTRRLVKAPRGWPELSYCDTFAMPPAVWWWNGKHDRVGVRQECPHGQPGDRLYVREAWSHDGLDLETVRAAHEDALPGGSYGPYYRATEFAPDTLRWRPSIHMPKWAARLWLEVTGVRVERLQDISEADAIAEGVEAISMDDVRRQATWSHRQDFAQLWDLLNTKRAPWDSNPWVWVISFKRLHR